jgi:hypothetical protein
MNISTPQTVPPRAEQARHQVADIRRRITAITGYTGDQLNEMIFDQAYEWLRYIGCNPAGVSAITATRQFWLFWKREWHAMDLAFIVHYTRWQYHTGHREWYAHFHSNRHHYMDSPSIHAAYHQMVKDIAANRP